MGFAGREENELRLKGQDGVVVDDTKENASRYEKRVWNFDSFMIRHL